MKALKIKKGLRFGRLTIMSESENAGVYRKFLVRCDCGIEKIVLLNSLRMKKTRSCGCLNEEQRKTNSLKHGHNRRASGMTPTYQTWNSLVQRCQNRKNKSYANYGGRGIKVCKRWMKFENFLKDMGERPDGLTIERINNDKGYSPKNCKWATITEQNNNKRNNKNYGNKR